jgi:hypothetical protein
MTTDTAARPDSRCDASRLAEGAALVLLENRRGTAVDISAKKGICDGVTGTSLKK